MSEIKFDQTNVLEISTMLEEATMNVEKVYNSGYSVGRRDGENSGGYTEGYTTGYAACEDAFWDVIQKSGNRTAYDTAFCWWDSEYLHPKYKVVPTYNGGARNMIYRCDNLKKIEAAYFDLSQLPDPMGTSGGLGYLFGLCNALEEVEDVKIQPCYSLEAFCYSDPKLKKVAVVRVAEETIVRNMLYYCRALEDVTIEGTIGQSGINLQYSTKLSKASVESFINALSDNVTGQSITFSKNAVDEAFFGYGAYVDDSGEVIWQHDLAGSFSVEWMDLVATKSNWTITLV